MASASRSNAWTLPSARRYPYSQPQGYAYGATSPGVLAFPSFATSAPEQEAVAELWWLLLNGCQGTGGRSLKQEEARGRMGYKRNR